MKEINVEFQYPDNSFYFSHREVLGYFTMVSNHFHDQFEIYYLLSGERYYFVEDRIFHVKAGDLVLIDERSLHKTTEANVRNHERVLINFNRECFLSFPYAEEILNEIFKKNNNVISFLPADRKYVEALLQKMTREIQNKAIGFEMALQAGLIEILVYIRRYIEKNNNDPLEHPSPIHEKISEIVRYINNNYAMPLSLDVISKKFFISQYYLSRTFKQTTGFTFIEYINSIRIREAQRLLRETDDKIIDISEKIGFGSVSQFGRVFKGITNFSPLNYRKLNPRKEKR